jgi:hypothetical protein
MQGTAVADVSTAIAALPYTIASRTTQGGNVTLQSQGDVVVAKGATINVSGGQTDYTGGTVATTQLIASNGQTYDIGQASPNLTYVGLVNPTSSQTYTGWGVTSTLSSPGTGKYEPGYIQGASAGTIQVAAPNMVLNGTLLGKAYNGPYQREPALPATSPNLTTMSNPTTMASGGELQIGLTPAQGLITNGEPDFLASAVQFTAQPTTISVADGAPFPGQQTLYLPIAYLTQGGFTRTQIYSNQSVTLPTGLPLSLAAESSLMLTAPRIAIDSNISTPDGALEFATALTAFDPNGLNPERQGIDIGTGVVLDVRGQWTNDQLTAQGGSQPTGQIAQNGGTINLTLGGNAGELTLGNNSALEASGGAWYSATGTLTGGTGGNISLSAGGQFDALQIGSGVSLDAFGAQTALGGTFSLTTNRIEIAQGSTWSGSAPQTVDELNAPGVLQLTSALFSQYGFSNVSLTASGSSTVVSPTDNVLKVDAATSILAQESNLMLTSQLATTPSGGSIMGFSHVSLLPDYLRKPEDVTLNYAAFVGETTDSNIPNAGEILIGSGAKIQVDPTGKINLSSTGSVDVEGTLQALAGTITILDVASAAAEQANTYFPSQGIVLGSGSVINAQGTSVYSPNQSGLLLGSVYGGGNVSILAGIGNVTAAAGSQIDVHGASAPLDIIGSNGAYSQETVGTTGGSVSIGSGRTIQLYGSINAAAGSGSTLAASGGSLTISLDPFGTDASAGATNSTPGSRTIEVVSSALPNAYTAASNGITYLSAPALEKTGAASITLQTTFDPNAYVPPASNPNQPGALIQLDPGVTLSTDESLTLDSPAIVMTSGAATLKAPLVTLTNSSQIQLTNSTGGAGTLKVQGDFIDLLGWTMLQGVGTAVLTSTGDVRLDSLLYTTVSSGPQTNSGGLSVGGDLTINAARVYPSTLAQFTLTSTGTTGTIAIGGPAQSTATSSEIPLSAQGAVTIAADNIVNSGYLYAPFGQLTFNAANSLDFAKGSVTSVSGSGQIIPYGSVIDGTWQYTGAQDNGTTISGVPNRQVSLNAPAITISNGATVDLRGGGDLYAYQFEPGTGGTVDALSPAVTPGLYAILPQLQGQYAPYDP